VPPNGAEFRRYHRILEGKHFKSVFDNRFRLHSTYFSFHLLPNNEEFHRLGLAVSKKVSKKAVERNRIKRQIRESFRYFQSTAIQQGKVVGCDFVVVAKTSAGRAENAMLKQELDQYWIKARDKCAKL
jgi:ribonuclease P protein component